MKLVKFVCFVIFLLIHGFSFGQSKTNYLEGSFKSGDTKIFGFVTNLPQQFVGFNFVKLSNTNLGVFIDMKAGLPIRTNDDDDFYDNISVNKAENIFGDQLLNKDNHWFSINAGSTKVISQYTAIYVGLGVSLYSEYRQYKDDFEILGDNGKYWIENDDKSKTTINALGGIIFKINPTWVMQIGAEAQPTGISIGFGKIF